MKKFVIGFLLATFSICVFLASLPVRADSAAPKDEEMEPYGFFPTLKVLDVPVVGQIRDLECWAACGSSVCRYYGYNVSKDQFAILTGITDNRMASFQDMIPTFNHYDLTPTEIIAPLSFNTVQSIIYNEAEPIIANVTYHAAVIDGYSYEARQKVRIMDPWDKGSRLYADYFELADKMGEGNVAPDVHMRWTRTLYGF